MKVLTSVLLVSFLGAYVLAYQSERKIVPPGMREADQLPGPADVPSVTQTSGARTSSDVMREQASDLAGLAQSIPADIVQVGKGALPKDMGEKLKRIEKLSKTLRSELYR